MAWQSVAKWPYPQVRLGNAMNTSTDRHETKEQAVAVARALMERGFGGNGNIFPIEAYAMEIVEPGNARELERQAKPV